MNCASGLRIFRYAVSSLGKRRKKFLTLSDLHIFSERDYENMDIIIEELKSVHYDAIFLDGDIIDQTRVLRADEKTTNRLLWFIASLGEIAPTYVVYGNHDLGIYSNNYAKWFKTPWIDDCSVFKEKFNDRIAGYDGIHIVDNKVESLGDGYTVCGVSPGMDYILKDSNGEIDKVLDSIDLSFLTDLKENDFNILLCHYPNVVFDLYKLGYLKRVDVALSGHNHNGCTQLKIFPVEKLFDLFGMKNRGLVTPSMSVKFSNTSTLRGVKELDDRTNLVINPCIKTFSATGDSWELLDGLFYKGATSVECIPEEEIVLKKK